MKKLPKDLKPYTATELMTMKSEFENNLAQIKIHLEQNKTNPHPDPTWETRAIQASKYMGREIQRICTEQSKRKTSIDALALQEFVRLVFEEFEDGEAQEMMDEAYEIARSKRQE